MSQSMSQSPLTAWSRPRALEGYCQVAFRVPGGQRIITERERACEAGDPLPGHLSWQRSYDSMAPKKADPKKADPKKAVPKKTGRNKASNAVNRLRFVTLTWRGPNRPCRVSGGGRCKSRPVLHR